jgi:YidC/Oxa1 family membrane protein insertase
MQNQQRFILALVASAAVLILWNYAFPPVKPPPPNANANTAQTAGASPQPTAPPVAAAATPQPSPTVAAVPDSVPRRTVRVVTPLYEATFDTRGAVATSWILKKNKNKATGSGLYSAASTKTDRKPLELIPAPPPEVSPDQIFQLFRIVTGDATLDGSLANRDFQITGSTESGNETINIPNGSKRVDFVLHDDSSGLDATKSITFFADQYYSSIEVKLTHNGQPAPPASLAIGPSIGDQGIDKYTYYSYAPEGIAVVNGEAKRINALQVHSDRKDVGTFRRLSEWIGIEPTSTKPIDIDQIDGAVQWAGVGDTYFAMVAIPQKPVQGLEYRTVAYEHKVADKPEPRFLITGFMPISADGTPTQLYCGPKDHTLLADASAEIKQSGGPQIDLGAAINYGFLGGMRRFLAVPILYSINELQKLTGSYGVAIILFTIFIYSLFFPLKWQSSRKMKKAQKYAPRMKEIQEKLKGMKQTDARMKELQREQLRLMKEANPLGGCLPLLIQMPFLFALYSAITISIDFRQATFLWIPDLAAAEPYLFGLVRVLPIFFAGSMIILQLMTPAPSADPMQRKMMAVGMPLFMLYILWSAPAGLLIYWLVGNVVGFGQQLIINRLTKSEDESPPPEGKLAKQKSPKKLSPAGA